MQKEPKHSACEKQQARALGQSPWWHNTIVQGLCACCQRHSHPNELTMDHIVPLAWGGRSTKGHMVLCCPMCTKKYWTPAELLLQNFRERDPR